MRIGFVIGVVTVVGTVVASAVVDAVTGVEVVPFSITRAEYSATANAEILFSTAAI